MMQAAIFRYQSFYITDTGLMHSALLCNSAVL